MLTGAAAPGAVGGFCSGGDRRSGRSAGMELGVPPDALDGDLARHDHHAAMLLHLMPKPTIAMVGGPAVGAGCSLAAACDLRFASDDAVFAAGFTPQRPVGRLRRHLLVDADRRHGGGPSPLPAEREDPGGPGAGASGWCTPWYRRDELAAHVRDVAARLARIPRELLALVKDNLNQAEDDAERRRFLFANEANNQIEAGGARCASGPPQ